MLESANALPRTAPAMPSSSRILRFRGAAAVLAVLMAMPFCTLQAAEPPYSVEVRYSRALDLFNLLDNLPDWLPGYTSPVYREAWQRRFGLTDQDRALLADYAAFRQRTSPLARSGSEPSAPADRLFAGADTRTGDPYARHFLAAPSFPAAVEAAIEGQGREDQLLLRRYYAHFAPRAEQLLATQAPFVAQQASLARQLAAPAVLALAQQMKAFFNVEDSPVFQVRFVWWPEAERTQAKLRGGYILLFSTFESDDDWAPIVMHEFSHFLSAGQPVPQRRILAESFAALCPEALALPNPLNALEEPLAIYWGQYRFEQQVRGQALSAESAWYVQPQADRAAKALATAFPAGGPAPRLEVGPLLRAAASACSVAEDGQR
ncbi:hypothetical protein [Stenotrophomonas maltophilia]|uniref:hypothetical protein n=1 Tax=Stenotrophomonas maltophilia TaxID=40324 RepID=UPI0031B7F608